MTGRDATEGEIVEIERKLRSGRDPRRAYRVVDDFEAELADYTGAKYAVTVDSCTNALLLAFVHEKQTNALDRVRLPRHTYVGVLQAALNAGLEVDWFDSDWEGWYAIPPTSIRDHAREIPHRLLMNGKTVCLSFHAAKQLPLGRGGAILTDDRFAASWFRAARMDGRPPGSSETFFPGFHCPMPPDTAARGLWILSRWNDANYTPPPLPHEDYPDLSLLHPGDQDETKKIRSVGYWPYREHAHD